MYQLLSIIELTCILSLVSIAAVFTFRFAGFPDLSVDGVFTLGAVVFVKLLLSGCGVPIAIFGAIVAGLLIGAGTSTIASHLHVNPLLASVLTLTILQTVNLRILGSANLPILDALNWVFITEWLRIAFFIVVAASIFILALIFFKTELGTAMRSAGSSPEFLKTVARNPVFYSMVLVSLAGGAIALSGALLALKFGFADVTIGMGTIIIGIASLIIGEKICGRASLLPQLVAAPVGIFIYEVLVGLAYSLGVSPADVKLGTGLLVIILLGLNRNERDKLLT
jgi:putative ABC transport system permease protein